MAITVNEKIAYILTMTGSILGFCCGIWDNMVAYADSAPLDASFTDMFSNSIDLKVFIYSLIGMILGRALFRIIKLLSK